MVEVETAAKQRQRRPEPRTGGSMVGQETAGKSSSNRLATAAVDGGDGGGARGGGEMRRLEAEEGDDTSRLRLPKAIYRDDKNGIINEYKMN